MVLGQVKTDEKANKITAIPELLRILDLVGTIVTIDAMGCQENITSKITDKETDYLLAVKQKQLYEDVEDEFHFSKVITSGTSIGLLKSLAVALLCLYFLPCYRTK